MAQANVASEPSMEEILASIRKIIESNDDEENVEAQAHQQAELQGSEADDQAASPAMKAANEQTGSAKPRGPASRPGAAETPPAQQPRRAVGPATPAPKPAQIDAGQPARLAAQSNQDPVSLAEVAAEVENPSNGGPQVNARARREEAVPPELMRRDAVRPATEQTVEVAKPRDDSKRQPAAASPQAGGRAGADRSAAGALISAEAGAKVAASFTGLNQALVKSPDRNFEQMAEDMLRPMLQQWLDDNLPTLVERLVREEIERVARGS